MSILEDSVVINYFRERYEAVIQRIREQDDDFVRGAGMVGFAAFHLVILAVSAILLWKYTIARIVGLGIIIGLLLIEAITALGRYLRN